jgi:hypothetical protein
MLLVTGCVASAQPKCMLANCPENGRVVYQYSSGVVYDGDVLAGRAWGKGKSTDKDGSTYVGDFVAGEMSGKGELHTPSGLKYTGEFQNNVINGQGVMIIPGKTTHSLSGRVLFLPIGVKISGRWVNGEIVQGRLDWDDGRIYEGRSDKFKRLGQGTTTYTDGSQACGEWNDTAPVVLYTPEQFNAIRPTGLCNP